MRKKLKLASEQTPEDRLLELKLAVYSSYARRFLDRHMHERLRDKPPEIISVSVIEPNRNRQDKALRILRDNKVILSNHINLDLFHEEAPTLAEFNPNAFKLNTKRYFTYKGAGYNSINIEDIGLDSFYQMNPKLTLWCYFNQDKIKVEKINSDLYTGTFVRLLDDNLVIKHKLLFILSQELVNEPTKNLAEFLGIKWVGKLSNFPMLSDHSSEKIRYTPTNIRRAYSKLRKFADHVTSYTNMMEEIWDRIKTEDRETQTIDFIKYLIKSMPQKAPLNLEDNKNKFILENLPHFTFENLFPNSLTLNEIKDYIKYPD